MLSPGAEFQNTQDQSANVPGLTHKFGMRSAPYHLQTSILAEHLLVQRAIKMRML